MTQSVAVKLKEHTKFGDDVIRFFNGDRNIDLIPHIFSGGDETARLWSNLVTSPEYYIYDEECELFKQSVDAVVKIAPDIDVVVDLGCGSSEAVQRIASNYIQSLPKLRIYAPVDLNSEFLEQAQDIAHFARKDISVVPVKADIYDDNKPAFLGKRALFIFAGAALINTPENEYPFEAIERLKQIKKQMKKGDLLAVGYDSCTDAAAVLPSYNQKENKDFCVNFMNTVAGHSSCCGLDASGFKAEIEWNSENNAVHMFLIPQFDQSFTIENESVTVRKGDKLHLSTSSRYPVELFEEMAHASGFNPLSYKVSPTKRTTVHILQA